MNTDTKIIVQRRLIWRLESARRHGRNADFLTELNSRDSEGSRKGEVEDVWRRKN